MLTKKDNFELELVSNGKAMWTYVTTGYENSTMVSIEKGLEEGEEVIYENNLGLSHEANVVKDRS